jgi:hypothetical protein
MTRARSAVRSFVPVDSKSHLPSVLYPSEIISSDDGGGEKKNFTQACKAVTGPNGDRMVNLDQVGSGERQFGDVRS